MTEWPESVPVLTAKDMWAGNYVNEDGTKRCLMGWMRGLGLDEETYLEGHEALARAIGSPYIATWNDSHTPQERADAWNAAMRSLGYTEVIDG